MITQHPHLETAVYCGCMDGRTALSDAMLRQYQASRQTHGEVFRLFWGGGPYLFLILPEQDFALRHFLLAYKVHAFKKVYLSLHMSCGAYAVLGGQKFSSRNDEITVKWADLDAIV